MNINNALTHVLPNLNIALVVVMVILFIKMFMRKSTGKVFYLPWKLLFVALMIFVVEELLTALRFAGMIDYPHMVINGFFEMGIITTFIYMVLIQREWAVQKKL